MFSVKYHVVTMFYSEVLLLNVFVEVLCCYVSLHSTMLLATMFECDVQL